jgi:competence protein ComEC
MKELFSDTLAAIIGIMYRLFFSFILGILGAYLLPEYLGFMAYPFWMIISSILLFTILLERLKWRFYGRNIIISGTFYFSFFTLGVFSFQRSLPSSLVENTKESLWVFSVESVIKQKASSVQLALRFKQSRDSLLPAKEALIWAFVALDSLQEAPQVGQSLWLETKILGLPKVTNPGAFDFGGYLLQKGYSGQVFLRAGEWGYINRLRGSPSFIKEWQSYLLQEIESWHWNKERESVFKALLLGYKNDLTTELKSDFAAAGAMHLLAVSGLHVGIVYLLLSYLLVGLRYFKNLQLVSSLLIILGIWLYAFISGASPSVLRSATMFSIMAAAQNLERPGSSFRSIFLSAFLMLIYNAQWLFDLGFQLSYSALLGILIWQPKIESLLHIKSRALNWVYKLVSVSLAAQIGTLPLSLYYFHQFPTYFWLSNILMIPLVTLLMYSGFLLLLLGQAEVLAPAYDLLGNLFGVLINLNDFIANLPMALIVNIPFSALQALLLAGLVSALSVFVLHQRRSFLYASVIILCLFSGNKLWTRYARISSNEMFIYADRSLVMSLREGETFYGFATDRDKLDSYQKYLWRDHMLEEGLNPDDLKFFKLE